MKREPRMLTTADVCERLNVSDSTARRIMSRLRCVDISRPGTLAAPPGSPVRSRYRYCHSCQFPFLWTYLLISVLKPISRPLQHPRHEKTLCLRPTPLQGVASGCAYSAGRGVAVLVV